MIELKHHLQNLPASVRGTLWMILATLLFTTMHALIRTASQELHPFQIAFLRNLFGLLVFTPWLLRSGPRIFRTQQFGLHAIRSIVMSVNMLAAFTAISLIPLAQVAALQMATPLAITLGAILFLGERARIRRWTALLCGLIGALIIIRPGVETISLGTWLMLVVVVLGSTGRLMAKAMIRRDSPVTISAYLNFLMTPITLVPALLVWEPLTWSTATLLVLLGITGTVAQLTVVKAYQSADMGAVEPITFLRLIWAALFGYWLFGEFPDLWTWIGASIIFTSATYVAIRESRLRAARELDGKSGK